MEHLKEFSVYKSKLGIVFGAFYMMFLTSYFLTPRPPNSENMYISLYVMFGGGIFVCIPMFYWMNEFSTPPASVTIENPAKTRPFIVVSDEPPEYESVVTYPPEVTTTAPPAYEEVIRIGEDLQVAVPGRSAISDGVILCPVHTQRFSDRAEQVSEK